MGRKIIGIVLVTLLLSTGVFFLLNFLAKRKPANQTAAVQSSALAQPKNYVDPYPNDLDRDGIPNDEEQKLGLNPKEFDTDGDALSDYNEIHTWKTDPKKVDTDGDGIRDGVEVIERRDPLKK